MVGSWKCNLAHVKSLSKTRNLSKQQLYDFIKYNTVTIPNGFVIIDQIAI